MSKTWDDKFGWIVDNKPYHEFDDIANINGVIKDDDGSITIVTNGNVKTVVGVGKDAPIETNEDGGKQSTTQYAMHLLDPDFLDAMVAEEGPLHYIANFMRDNTVSTDLFLALEEALDLPTIEFPRHRAYSRLLTIGRVLKEGADKYEANNWRLIPQESHLNHAIIHYIAYVLGDESDDHLAHFATRVMMAYATECTPGFSYNRYIKDCKDKEIKPIDKKE